MIEELDSIRDIRLISAKEREITQYIRLADVFVIAPILVYTGAKYYKQLPNYLAIALIVIGVATFIYNGNNYLRNR
jgi:hypothetical protein